jgi:aspartate/methionine/tyrosine aminotransferase
VESLQAVNALCADRGLCHIHDEAYEYFTYEGTAHVSPGSFEGASGHTISLYSLSKAYGMASWRIGYMVIPDALWDAVNKIQDTLLICPPAVSQHAALAALRVGRSCAEAHLPQLDAMRELVFAALSRPDVPCDLAHVRGAFYYFVRIHSALDAMSACERLIRRHQVAVIPGSAFGEAAGCSIRISYGALSSDSVSEGVRRLVGGIHDLARSR